MLRLILPNKSFLFIERDFNASAISLVIETIVSCFSNRISDEKISVFKINKKSDFFGAAKAAKLTAFSNPVRL